MSDRSSVFFNKLSHLAFIKVTPDNFRRTLDADNNGYLDFTEFLLAMDLVAAR